MSPRNVLLLFAVCSVSCALAAATPPHLERHGDAVRLVVDGEPFVIVGGEAHNSSSSEPALFQKVCSRFRNLNANTILAPVTWEQFEPEEGRFDYAQIDGMIRSAHDSHLKLVVLWFGSWKNGVSSYVPAWIKCDTVRFPRACHADGPTDVLSALSTTNRLADARAFAFLMARIKVQDPHGDTVIMVQVENEVGLRGVSRDVSAAADHARAGVVPQVLLDYLSAHRAALRPELLACWAKNGFRAGGTWSEVFGDGPDADEVFTAWTYAAYVNAVATAGKSAYDLPMYANAWLPAPGGAPGNYPCGGPVPAMLDVWRAAAPALDFLAPDIYLPEFARVTADYRHAGNPLFVPECGRGDDVEARACWALGHHHALGFSPFGFEDFPPDHVVTRVYRGLSGLAPFIGTAQGSPRLAAAICRSWQDPYEERLVMDGWTLNVSLRSGQEGRGCVLVVQKDADTFFATGHDFIITPVDGAILSVEVGWFEEGVFHPVARLNGDETDHGSFIRCESRPAHSLLNDDLRGIYRFRLLRK